MKKLLTIALISTLMLSMITGCGKDKETQVEPSVETESTAAEEAPAVAEEEPAAVEEAPAAVEEAPVATEETPAAVEGIYVGEGEVYSLEDVSGLINSSLVNVTDKTIYDENGVLLTFEALTPEGALLYLENNNPDNKKVMFSQDNYLNLNGVCCQQTEFILRTPLTSGESGVVSMAYDQGGYQLTMEQLDAADMGIETIGLSLGLMIGSDSEPIFVNKTLKTDAYNEGDIEKLYGEYVTTVNDTISDSFDITKKIPVDIYCKENSSGSITAVIVNKGEGSDVLDTGYCNIQMFANESELFPTGGGRVTSSGAVVLRCEESIDSIRKNHEIGDNEEMKITLQFFNATKMDTIAVLKEY